MKSYGRQDSSVPDGQILQRCREALLDLTATREREALLKKQVEEMRRVDGLKDERLALLEKSIAEYEKAIEARRKAELVVEELRKNYEAQLAAAQKQIASANRRAWLWRAVAVVAVIFALVTGARK